MTGELCLRTSDTNYIFHFEQGNLLGCTTGSPAVETSARKAVGDVFSWGEGWFSFVMPQTEQKTGTAESCSTAELILEGVRAIENLCLVEDALGRSEGLIQPADILPDDTAFEFSLVESFLLSRLEGPSTIEDICLVSPVTRPETLRSIYVLLCAGMLEGNGDPLQQDYACMSSPSEDGVLGAVRSFAGLGPTKPPGPTPGAGAVGRPTSGGGIAAAAGTAVCVETMPDPVVTSGLADGDPDDSLDMARYHFEKGLEHFTKEDYHSAVQLFQLAVKIDDRRAEYHRHLALALSRNPMWGRKAEQALRRAVELEPDHAETHYFLGRIYLDSNMPRRAMERFKESLRIDPDLEPAKLELAVMKGKARRKENEPVPVTLFDPT